MKNIEEAISEEIEAKKKQNNKHEQYKHMVSEFYERIKNTKEEMKKDEREDDEIETELKRMIQNYLK